MSPFFVFVFVFCCCCCCCCYYFCCYGGGGCCLLPDRSDIERISENLQIRWGLILLLLALLLERIVLVLHSFLRCCIHEKPKRIRDLQKRREMEHRRRHLQLQSQMQAHPHQPVGHTIRVESKMAPHLSPQMGRSSGSRSSGGGGGRKRM